MKRLKKSVLSSFFRIIESNVSVNIKKRTITLRNQITPMTAVTLLMWLEFFESLSSFDAIVLVIDSCRGGDWIAAKNIYALLKRVRPPVIGIAKSFVHSAALAIFAGTDERLVHVGTHFQFHTAESTYKFGVDARGNIVRMRAIKERETASLHAQLSKEVNVANEEFYEILTEGFAFPHSYIARMLCEKEYEFHVKDVTAREIMHLGIVHAIISQRKTRKHKTSRKKR